MDETHDVEVDLPPRELLNECRLEDDILEDDILEDGRLVLDDEVAAADADEVDEAKVVMLCCSSLTSPNKDSILIFLLDDDEVEVEDDEEDVVDSIATSLVYLYDYCILSRVLLDLREQL